MLRLKRTFPSSEGQTSGTESSNPALSATQSELQRNQAVLLQESLKIAAIPQVLPSSRTGESVPSTPAGKFSGAFLWRAHVQSDFTDFLRRMQSITNR